MALLLTKELETGVTGNYWRINSDSGFNAVEGKGAFVVGLYLNQATRNAGKKPLTLKSYRVDLQSFDRTESTLDQLYTYLKTLPEFVGATDI